MVIPSELYCCHILLAPKNKKKGKIKNEEKITKERYENYILLTQKMKVPTCKNANVYPTLYIYTIYVYVQVRLRTYVPESIPLPANYLPRRKIVSKEKERRKPKEKNVHTHTHTNK